MEAAALSVPDFAQPCLTLTLVCVEIYQILQLEMFALQIANAPRPVVVQLGRWCQQVAVH